MKLSELLRSRQALVQRTSLANLAFAFQLLSDFAVRLVRARLTGRVTLASADLSDDRPWATLTAREGRQSVIEEHFTDEDLMDLADAVEFVTASDRVDLTFNLEDFAGNFLVPVRHALEQSGIVIDCDQPALKAHSSTDPA